MREFLVEIHSTFSLCICLFCLMYKYLFGSMTTGPHSWLHAHTPLPVVCDACVHLIQEYTWWWWWTQPTAKVISGRRTRFLTAHDPSLTTHNRFHAERRLCGITQQNGEVGRDENKTRIELLAADWHMQSYRIVLTDSIRLWRNWFLSL